MKHVEGIWIGSFRPAAAAVAGLADHAVCLLAITSVGYQVGVGEVIAASTLELPIT